VSSDEVENTLADVHYDPTEDNDDSWPTLFGPFSPSSYDYKSGHRSSCRRPSPEADRGGSWHAHRR
jgi:hypothetical protein